MCSSVNGERGTVSGVGDKLYRGKMVCLITVVEDGRRTKCTQTLGDLTPNFLYPLVRSSSGFI